MTAKVEMKAVDKGGLAGVREGCIVCRWSGQGGAVMAMRRRVQERQGELWVVSESLPSGSGHVF